MSSDTVSDDVTFTKLIKILSTRSGLLHPGCPYTFNKGIAREKIPCLAGDDYIFVPTFAGKVDIFICLGNMGYELDVGRSEFCVAYQQDILTKEGHRLHLITSDYDEFKEMKPTIHYIQAFVTAISKGDLEIAKPFLKGGYVDPNTPFNPDGDTAIHDSAHKGRLNIVRYLVEEAKVDPNKEGAYGWTAIYIAAFNGHLDIVRYLVEKAKVDPNKTAENGWTLTHDAANEGHLDIVRYLVEQAKVDPNKANNDGWTPIYIAAQEGHLDVLEYLIVILGENRMKYFP